MPSILVVEDYPSIQKIYQTVLSQEGYTVALASDGKEALEKATANPPELILLDLLMPNLGGLEFLRAFNLANHPDTKVIVFSNLASPELAQEAKELGASQYLTKSNFTPKKLLEVIHQTLAEKP